MRLWQLGTLICFVVSVASLAGCSEDYQSLPDSDQALSTHISVLSIGRWADYSYALQPKFKLSAEEARSEAIPNTGDVSNSLVDSLAASLAVGYGSGPTSTPTTQSSTAATQPATPPAATAPSLPTVPVQASPFVQYDAGTALYQEVKLIDRYVRDAAIGDKYEPYVVRLQVTVMPGQRDTDLDAYTLISFFLRHPACGASDLRIIPLLVTDEISAASESNSAQQVRALQVELELAFKGIGASGGVSGLYQKLNAVLDNSFSSAFTVAQASENTLKVRFGSVLSGAGYKLLPQTHDVTVLLLVPRRQMIRRCAKISAYSLTTYVNPVSGRSYRETQDQLMDKIGQVIVDYRTLGKETKPCENALIRAAQIVVSRIFPLDLRRGGALSYMANAQAVLKELMRNDYKGFCSTMRNVKGIACEVYPFLWIDLTDILSHGPYDVTHFRLGRLRSPSVLSFQSPILEDNGTDRTDVLVSVRNAENFRDGYLSAWLSVPAKNGPTLRRDIPALTHWVGSQGQLHLLFPSLKADTLLDAKNTSKENSLSATAAGSNTNCRKIRLYLRFRPMYDTGWDPVCDCFPDCIYVMTNTGAVTPPNDLIRVPTHICMASPQGGGTIELAIGESTQIELSGGDISTATNEMGTAVLPTTGKAGIGWWEFPAGDYHIALTDLDTRTPVVVKAENSTVTAGSAAGGGGVSVPPQTIKVTVVAASVGHAASSGAGGTGCGGGTADVNGRTNRSTVSATVNTAPAPSPAQATNALGK